MSARPEKILALQFKYFGDAVLLTPALRALREHLPDAELHLLVPEEIAPLFQHLPSLNRVWPMPRRRGRASLGETWPLIRALRREQFDRSVDFASNDRGAILSFLTGARRRLGWDETRRIFRPEILLHPARRAGGETAARIRAAGSPSFRLAGSAAGFARSRNPCRSVVGRRCKRNSSERIRGHLPRRRRPAEKGMAAGTLGRIASRSRRSWISRRLHYASRRT